VDHNELMWIIIAIFYDKTMERYRVGIKKLMALIFGFGLNKKRKAKKFLIILRVKFVKKIKKFHDLVVLLTNVDY